MNKNRETVLTLVAFIIGALFCLLPSQSAQAQDGTVIFRSQFRRTVDPSPRAAYGNVAVTIGADGRQTMVVTVNDLGADNYEPVFFEAPTVTTNIVPALNLPPLDRTGLRSGNWQRVLHIVDFSPFIESLTELAGNELDVAQPGIPSVTTIFTNITGGVTNISLGVTNIVGGVTNIVNGIVIPNPGQTGEVFSVLWAPMYPLSADLNKLSYHRHGELYAIGQASPNAKGHVTISFDGNTGRSVLKIRAADLTKGQQYTLFVANDTNQEMTVMLPIDNMTQKNLGATATFLRDTQFADPLPLQARDIGDLSGRTIQIRDAFDNVHLQGVMP